MAKGRSYNVNAIGRRAMRKAIEDMMTGANQMLDIAERTKSDKQRGLATSGARLLVSTALMAAMETGMKAEREKLAAALSKL